MMREWSITTHCNHLSSTSSTHRYDHKKHGNVRFSSWFLWWSTSTDLGHFSMRLKETLPDSESQHKMVLMDKLCQACFYRLAWTFLGRTFGINHMDMDCSMSNENCCLYHELLLLRGSFPNLPWTSPSLVLVPTFFPTKSLFLLLWFTQIFHFVRPFITIVIVKVKVLNVINVFARVRRTVTLAPSTRPAPPPRQVQRGGRWRWRHGGGRHVEDRGGRGTRVRNPVACQWPGPWGVRGREGCEGRGGIDQGIWLLLLKWKILWLLAAKDVRRNLVIRRGWIAVLATDSLPGCGVPD